MPKRILAASVGLIAIVAGCVTLIYAFSAADGHPGTNDTSKPDVVAGFVMLLIAGALFALGLRFLRFAWKGSVVHGNGWLRPTLLGIGFFFPGFVFSLPLTLAWETFRRPCAEPGDNIALKISTCIGIVSATVCFVVLMKRRKLRSKT